MISYKLRKQPRGVTIIQGFPSIGLVSTIAVEFLLEHLKAERIGEFYYKELPATAAIHKGKLIHPMSIWHVDKLNLVVLHTILDVKGFEWELAELILDLAKKLKAKEVISIEGVASPEEAKTYTYNNKRMEECGAEPLKESVITGVSAALLLTSGKVTPLFASTHSELPDSAAAAKIIEVLDKYLGLGVDYEPLLEQAKAFEEKLKSIMRQARETEEEIDKKKISYLG